MGRLEISMRCMEIRSLLESGELEQAYELAENLDIERVNSVVDLKVIASVYERMGQYEDALEVLHRSYEKKPTKMAVYRLAYLCVKTENFDDAEFFYREFSAMAPNSPDKYVLRYGIDRAKGVDYYIRIATLQELKAIDYREEWGYELAKVYHKAGLYEDCVRECDDLILWFGEGVIVEKAKLLKKYHTEGKASLDVYGVFDKNLTPEQLELNREKFRYDTRDLATHMAEVEKTEKKKQLKTDLKRDLEKTIDLRKAMIEDSEALDLLGREVHRSWGSAAPAQGSEVIQIKKLRTRDEQTGFFKRRKNNPDMEEILAEEEQETDSIPAEEDWEIRESVAVHPHSEPIEPGKFQAAKLQAELAKEIARFNSEDEEDSNFAEDYSATPISKQQNTGRVTLQNTKEIIPPKEDISQIPLPEQELLYEYEEELSQDWDLEEEPVYEEEEIPEGVEPVYEEEEIPEEIASEEELFHEEEVPEEIDSEEEPVYEEQETPEGVELEEEPVYEEEEVPEEIASEEELFHEEEVPEEIDSEEEPVYEEEETPEGVEPVYEEEEVPEKIEPEEEIPAYVQRDRKSQPTDIFNEVDSKEIVDEPTGEIKTMKILRSLLSGRRNNKQRDKKKKDLRNTQEFEPIKSEQPDAEQENTEQRKIKGKIKHKDIDIIDIEKAEMEPENPEPEKEPETATDGKPVKKQGEAKVNVVKVKPAAAKDNKTKEKTLKKEKEESVTKGVVKRYMGKKTEEAKPESEKNTTKTKIEAAEQETNISMKDVWDLFPQYKGNDRICEGLRSLLQGVFGEKDFRNMIITSKNPIAARELCSDIAEVLSGYGVLEKSVIKIMSADELNKMHLEQNYGQLQGGILQITGARRITPDTAQSIMNMVEELKNQIIVVLNDGKPYMDDFMNQYKIMQKYFPYWIIL